MIERDPQEQGRRNRLAKHLWNKRKVKRKGLRRAICYDVRGLARRYKELLIAKFGEETAQRFRDEIENGDGYLPDEVRETEDLMQQALEDMGFDPLWRHDPEIHEAFFIFGLGYQEFENGQAVRRHV